MNLFGNCGNNNGGCDWIWILIIIVIFICCCDNNNFGGCGCNDKCC